MKTLTRRYAAALADVAVESGAAERVQQELGEFVSLWKQSAELRNFLASPAIPRNDKLAVVEKLAKKLGFGTILKNFLSVLVDNRRTGLLAEIHDAYLAQIDQRMGITEAQVTSAYALGDAEKKELRRALEEFTGKQVRAEYALDQELIGGLVVRIGSTILDGSVRSQLARLRARLASE